ncbi:MAG: MbnP family protein [Bacteroidota bacterium]
MKKRLIRIFFAYCLLFSLLTSCYEPVEGCLDVNAENYELEADDPCPNDGCCTYPELSLSISHLWNGDALRTDTFYRDDFGNAFQLTRLRYYWSELGLAQMDNSSEISLLDSMEFGLFTEMGDTVFQNLNSNLVLIDNLSNSSLSVGTFRSIGNVTSLIGQLGLRGDYSSVVPGILSSSHPLANQEGRMHFGADTSYVQIKLEYDLIVGADTSSRDIKLLITKYIYLST